MMSDKEREELVPREEARATLAARRELGPEYEDELVEAFAEKIERRLAKREKAELEHDEDRRGISFVAALVSLGCGIPITAIALSGGGIPALVVVWTAIVLVNVALARAR
jgi:hypothetical protein